MSFHTHFTEKELTLLHARASRVANATHEQQSDTALATLVVTLCGEAYALPTDAISAVYDEVPVVPVPCVPSFVAGIANIRGHIIPVLDLATLLGVPRKANTAQGALIVAETRAMSVALSVDAIGEMTRLPTGKLAPIPPALDIAKPEYLRGMLPDGTVLLDVETVLNDLSLTVDETAEPVKPSCL